MNGYFEVNNGSFVEKPDYSSGDSLKRSIFDQRMQFFEFVDRNCIVFTVRPITQYVKIEMIEKTYSWPDGFLAFIHVFFCSITVINIVVSSAFASGPIHPNNK